MPEVLFARGPCSERVLSGRRLASVPARVRKVERNSWADFWEVRVLEMITEGGREDVEDILVGGGVVVERE